MHDGTDAQQGRIAVEAEAGGQHFIGHAAVDVAEGGAIQAVPTAAHPAPAASTGETHHLVEAPTPGIIIKVLVEVGSTVAKNQPLVVMEAMKMESEVNSPVAGKSPKFTLLPVMPSRPATCSSLSVNWM